MAIKITDLDGVSTVHDAERLEIDLKSAKEVVEDMVVKVYFDVTTELPNGKEVGQLYWDSVPLELNCKNNPQLAEAMRVIQQAIGAGRYAQMTAPAPVASPATGTMPSPT